MSVRGVGRTDVGKERESNEDSLHLDHALGLYIVCDGMGGHAAGEVASSTAARVAATYLSDRHAAIAEGWQRGPDAVRELVAEAVREACREVHRLAQAVPQFGKMGTTLTLLLFDAAGAQAVMGHVGDSRLYQLRDGALTQLSYDHNHANELVRVGAITAEAARRHPYARYLSRAVGLHETVEVETCAIAAAPGDTFLLCSDGLTTHVQAEEDLARLLAAEAPEAAVDALVALALERGGRDNVSVIVARTDARPASAAATAGGAARVPEVAGALAEVAPQPRPGPNGREAVEALREVFLFNALSDEQLYAVLGVAEARSLQPGERLLGQDEPVAGLYVVIDGALTVVRSGRQLAELGPGKAVHALAFLDACPAVASVQAREATHLVAIARAPFAQLMRESHPIALRVYRALASEISARLPLEDAAVA